ncbi:MAG: cupin domain-containing protein [Calditrichaeota bacterium]|nr:cupin domain-containing protein [Calditrichota bacterium]
MSNENLGNLPGGKAINLASLVDYSPHSIVSREIVKNSSGSLTVFAFDAGQGLSEHTAPFDAVVQILDGEAEISVGKNTETANEGETVIMPANIPHALNAKKKFKMQLIMIKEKKQ